jgi:hypothetical protein
MARRPLDPRKVNIGLDANALDLDGSERDHLVRRFRELSSPGGALTVVVAGGVRGEVQHPKTPGAVQADMLPKIFNLRAGLNPIQAAERQRVAAIVQGNAKPETHAADASHLSEAAETGCGYFITHDKRILNKQRELAGILPPSLNIVTLTEFFAILDDYVEGRRP